MYHIRYPRLFFFLLLYVLFTLAVGLRVDTKASAASAKNHSQNVIGAINYAAGKILNTGSFAHGPRLMVAINSRSGEAYIRQCGDPLVANQAARFSRLAVATVSCSWPVRKAWSLKSTSVPLGRNRPLERHAVRKACMDLASFVRHNSSPKVRILCRRAERMAPLLARGVKPLTPRGVKLGFTCSSKRLSRLSDVKIDKFVLSRTLCGKRLKMVTLVRTPKPKPPAPKPVPVPPKPKPPAPPAVGPVRVVMHALDFNNAPIALSSGLFKGTVSCGGSIKSFSYDVAVGLPQQVATCHKGPLTVTDIVPATWTTDANYNSTVSLVMSDTKEGVVAMFVNRPKPAPFWVSARVDTGPTGQPVPPPLGLQMTVSCPGGNNQLIYTPAAASKPFTYCPVGSQVTWSMVQTNGNLYIEESSTPAATFTMPLKGVHASKIYLPLP
jgi:hypothetical protein